ncbi:MAG: DUF1460 domain-containing protein [Candidatus Marinimicrobia bacterium]|nr:DUF1460 domain-containing protein [Candidatus Neomarinimicrobiota bacterium]MBT3829223.1 DUF1460 domain-containing protein [Candidatus Neomarinimicrobiota bacterium]MBT3996783.1 DUF1460 domain-containing protein [Candidatus Neomarinimicrobiota bacterium]MBT4280347.1 DUF1460 domain-containing protein [Candidatus Neomarinimicrobiota bacterium]MBT4569841.1 DUF1460 domain-containing protein [Candidatus Neomarinimicrobiota bacterium]
MIRKKENGRIKKSIFLLLFLMVVFACSNNYDWVNSLPKPWTLSNKEVSKILPEFYKRFPDFYDRLKAFAIWRVGTPYDIFKLGEEAEPDLDPIIRLDVSDCTVHVLTSLAFTQSKSWNEARRKMIAIHYKDGTPTYKTRWHYTSDRISFHPSTVDITTELLSQGELEIIDIVLNQKLDGSEFLDLDWKKESTLLYIPNNNINKKLLSKLPDVCGIAFVKKDYFKSGIVIAHEGILINNKNLNHASSEYGQTVNVDFMDYYFRESGPLFDGLFIYRFEPLGKNN